MHALLPVTLVTEFSGHAKHDVNGSPLSGVYVPTGHCEHFCSPEVLEYQPPLHGEHSASTSRPKPGTTTQQQRSESNTIAVDRVGNRCSHE